MPYQPISLPPILWPVKLLLPLRPHRIPNPLCPSNSARLSPPDPRRELDLSHNHPYCKIFRPISANESKTHTDRWAHPGLNRSLFVKSRSVRTCRPAPLLRARDRTWAIRVRHVDARDGPEGTPSCLSPGRATIRATTRVEAIQRLCLPAPPAPAFPSEKKKKETAEIHPRLFPPFRNTSRTLKLNTKQEIINLAGTNPRNTLVRTKIRRQTKSDMRS